MKQLNAPAVNAAYADQVGIPSRISAMVSHVLFNDVNGTGFSIELTQHVSLSRPEMAALITMVRDIERTDVCHDAVAYCNARYTTEPKKWLSTYVRERHCYD